MKTPLKREKYRVHCTLHSPLSHPLDDVHLPAPRSFSIFSSALSRRALCASTITRRSSYCLFISPTIPSFNRTLPCCVAYGGSNAGAGDLSMPSPACRYQEAPPSTTPAGRRKRSRRHLPGQVAEGVGHTRPRVDNFKINFLCWGTEITKILIFFFTEII